MGLCISGGWGGGGGGGVTHYIGANAFSGVVRWRYACFGYVGVQISLRICVCKMRGGGGGMEMCFPVWVSNFRTNQLGLE